ncbi:hypothetical protein PC41400_14370 [Paenibacillus chitinolyticus]|uniref:Uncharacterized protein n=1 Tax=Paenibacillus chitinolyticus TaxID=79263 RepID=A0A410WWT0_9BACL|nr:hypothetical protein [Paenibacillus chitinolyticus]MCY9591446.1 hypothetical protein [Paenibacillus chitinolyticus]MCY9598572.1 hypothetical protein [Paenibacillus chitinolyticus]QAV18800.1 hypothetical protein PC41400_14370 [Paenibacillus chitinolyticus]
MKKANEGKKFEKNYENSVNSTSHFFLRLKDAPKWLRGSSATFTPENPCDGIQYAAPFLWLVELKSTKGSSISFNPERPEEKPRNKTTHVMIKAHQVKSLMKFATKDGLIPGFIFNFRERGTKTKYYPPETFFVHIYDFVKWTRNSKKSGINRDDCRTIGFPIQTTLDKDYDICKFIDDSLPSFISRGYLKIEFLKSVVNRLNLLIGDSKKK